MQCLTALQWRTTVTQTNLTFHWRTEMKKAIIGVYLATLATMTWASCTTHSYTMNGRFVTCTTCCYGGNCSTNCF
jgi:hypothetical protein